MILLPIPERGYHTAFWTMGLVLVNVLVFAVTWPLENHRASAVSRDEWRQAAADLQQIALPEAVNFPPEIQQALQESPRSDTFPSAMLLQSFHQIQTNPNSLASARRYEWDQRFPHFEAMTHSMASAREGSSPFRLFGFRPTLGWFPGVITHQFLHAGWIHLIGNMIFLWTVGFILEYALGGSILFVYLIGGVVAAWAQATWGHLGTEIMVGASGSIAALMGFALMAVPGARVKLGYLTFGRTGVFHSPLWFFLPLWIVEQLIQAGMHAGDETVKVGYVAHIGGFLVGCSAALILRLVFRVSFRTAQNPNASW